MKKICIELKKVLSSLYYTNFFTIFFSSVFSKIITFIGGIIIVRMLSQSDYGIYSYSANVISVLSIFGDFGTSSAILPFLVENKNNSAKFYGYLKYALKIAVVAGIFSLLLILLSPLYYPYSIPEAPKFVLIMSLIPIITILTNFVPTILRSKFENRLYSIFSFSTVLIHYAIIIPFCIFGGLYGSIISQSIYNTLVCIFGLILIFKNKILNFNDLKSSQCEKKEKKNFLKLSFGFQINNLLGNVLLILDIFILGLFVKDSSVIAIYKVATVIPQALNFIPASFALYILPHFVEKKNNKVWMKNKFKLIFRYSSILYGIISILLILFSKYIFLIIYGEKYISSVSCFNVLMLGFAFMSAFKLPIMNYFYSIKKMKLINSVTILSAILNIFLDIILYLLLGIYGIALATTIVNVVSSIMMIMLFYKEINKNEKPIN